MFARWAFAQAGVDIGLTTSTRWTANGLLPSGDTAQATASVTRGVGSEPPPGGYQPRISSSSESTTARAGTSPWLGDGQIVQCSSSGDSNIRPLAGYVAPTGWVRWRLAAGG